jgi:hypothetical protein
MRLWLTTWGESRKPACPRCRSLAVVLCLCFLVAFVAACGSRGSGIRGIVTERRPISAYIGGTPTPSPLPDRFGLSIGMPAVGRLTLLIEPVGGSKAGQVVATTQTQGGLFRVAVPPGRYVVVIKGGNAESNQTSRPVTVEAGRYSPLVLWMATH